MSSDSAGYSCFSSTPFQNWWSIIEFYKKEMAGGPPLSHRIDLPEARQLVEEAGFKVVKEMDISEQYYMLVLES